MGTTSYGFCQLCNTDGDISFDPEVRKDICLRCQSADICQRCGGCGKLDDSDMGRSWVLCPECRGYGRTTRPEVTTLLPDERILYVPCPWCVVDKEQRANMRCRMCQESGMAKVIAPTWYDTAPVPVKPPPPVWAAEF